MGDFDKLPKSLRLQIDSAFNHAHKLLSDPVSSGLVPPAAKRRRLNHDDGELANYVDEPIAEEEGGGFLVDDVDEDSGDIPRADIRGPHTPEPNIHPDSLALSLIPTAVSHSDVHALDCKT